ncbi:family 20 glycosylhydrolase [Actinomyces sp. F1_1611]
MSPLPLLPQPQSVLTDPEVTFPLDQPLRLEVDESLRLVVEVPLAEFLTASGAELTPDASRTIALQIEPDGWENPSPEAYRIRVEAERVQLSAPTDLGIIRALATLVQLVEDGHLPGAEIDDAPRFTWRGLTLDVARSFFPPNEVKQVIDLLARYKFNRLHLHLSDDQGWRLEVPSHPELTEISGPTAIAGGRGGFYTQAEFADLVGYAEARGIDVIPELDVPGHTNAATHACPELNPDGQPTDAYDGMQVGFSRLHAALPATREFLQSVFADAAEQTESAYLHLGGDEALALESDEYVQLVGEAVHAVLATGKEIVGWQEIAQAALPPGSVVQFWDGRSGTEAVVQAAERGALVVMSPAEHTYLDLKYDQSTELGQDWAGYVELSDSYQWEPTRVIEGLDPRAVVGVEAAIWTETIHSLEDLMVMLLPRLAAVAEVAWTEELNWESFTRRVAAQTSWWEGRQWPYHRSAGVSWPTPQAELG